MKAIRALNLPQLAGVGESTNATLYQSSSPSGHRLPLRVRCVLAEKLTLPRSSASVQVSPPEVSSGSG